MKHNIKGYINSDTLQTGLVLLPTCVYDQVANRSNWNIGNWEKDVMKPSVNVKKNGKYKSAVKMLVKKEDYLGIFIH